MPKVSEKHLLPAGFADGLPPDAGQEAAMVETLMATFAAWGYARVKPPLIEFEESLLSGPGAAMAAHTFRLMDPVSQRMMGLRADMTPQVGRIAAARLAAEPRPLRLSYAGQVLRVKGEQMRPARQIGQAGVELIGASEPAADAEAIALAAEALAAIGIDDLVVDLNLPTLIPALLKAQGRADAKPLIAALDRKDTSEVGRLAGKDARLLGALLAAQGPADAALEALARLRLPPRAAKERARLQAVVRLLGKTAPDIALTVDPTDQHGFEYHSGVTFSLLARGARAELGRGGRYINHAGEHATGFTLYLDALMQVAKPLPAAKRIYLPLGTKAAVAADLRRAGWQAINGLAAVRQPAQEARRLGCTYYWAQGGILPLSRNTSNRRRKK